jgi:ATP-dependent Clp protease ATP-binding subunit ClpC
MLCTNCHERPVTFRYRTTVNGRTQEFTLCSQCAQGFRARRGFDTGLSSQVTGETGIGETFGRALHPLLHSQRGHTNLAELLSDSARDHLTNAAVVAADFGSETVKPEHLLASLITDRSLAPVFERLLGTDVESLDDRLAQVIERGASLPEPEEVHLSPRLKRAVQLAHEFALRQGNRQIGPPQLILGLLAEGESLASQVLGEAGRGTPTQMAARLDENTQSTPTNQLTSKAKPRGTYLEKHTQDLTALARQGKLDPVIGREEEIERVIRILSRRTKNNPVLIGEPGVGKTAIADGLAQRIASGNVPDTLKGKSVLSLDLGGMVAGSKYRGEFEERLGGLIKEIKHHKGDVLLFIDELHTILGAGGAGEGDLDAANMLKPALSRGELHCIGATTLEEYRKRIEKDSALERRFQPVIVSEPTVEQTIEILRGLKDLYEGHHGVQLLDESLTAAAELTDKYVNDRFLPDKAIDVIDEACAMKHLATRQPPPEVRDLEKELLRMTASKEQRVRDEEYSQALETNERIKSIEQQLATIMKDWRSKQGKDEPTVELVDVARVVSEWTGIPAATLAVEERRHLLVMEEHLHRRVIGQDEAIQAVSESVRRARTGMKDSKRPIGSFIFLGPTGVGKTELAKALAEYLFSDEEALIRFDMSEFQEKHTVSRLLGAPPGYVGYEEAGQLTKALRRKPYSVVLFDEIEKAHPDVFNILLQMMDDGRLTDSQGRTVDCKNCVIIMTSNVGANRIFELEKSDGAWSDIKEAALTALKLQFRPEFINRVDDIVVFHPLTPQQLLEIVDLMLEGTRRKLTAQKLHVEFTEGAKAAIAEAGFDPTYGARPLRRVIQKDVETPISRLLLEKELVPGELLRIDAADGKFTFFLAGKKEEAPMVTIEPLKEGSGETVGKRKADERKDEKDKRP